jgi:aspartyl-tRNA(Asn)/glutamyl-tRNA(Gln) amidotransferase subunit B
MKKSLPELPEGKEKRFVRDYKINPYEAKVLCSDYGISNFYEAIAQQTNPLTTARFVSRELLAILNRSNLTLRDSGMQAKPVADLLTLFIDGKVSEKNAKEALIKYALEKTLPVDFLEKNSLLKDLGEPELISSVDSVMGKNKDAVADYKKNPAKVLNFLTGQVMRLTKGKAEPRAIQELIKEKLEKS